MTERQHLLECRLCNQHSDTAAHLILYKVHFGEDQSVPVDRAYVMARSIEAHTLSWMRSTFVRTLTWGASSCAMAASTCRQPAMNLGVSVTNWLSRQYTTHTCVIKASSMGTPGGCRRYQVYKVFAHSMLEGTKPNNLLQTEKLFDDCRKSGDLRPKSHLMTVEKMAI